ncbi:MAG: SDR family NAD(P)-dependent oxidoreductase [Pseudomonadales bacterium]
MKYALIAGASGGIGGALALDLCHSGDYQVIGTYHHREPTWTHAAMRWFRLDVHDPGAVALCLNDVPHIDLLINTIGMLSTDEIQPEKSLRQFRTEQLLAAVSLNAAPLLNLAQQASTALKAASNPKIIALSARVGSITDNQLGGWYSYRCSKAALNMAVRTLAIEWQRTLPRATLIAYHPGTVQTLLSAPFTARTKPEQLFSPDVAAGYLIDFISTLKPEHSGTFWDWSGRQIPW